MPRGAAYLFISGGQMELSRIVHPVRRPIPVVVGLCAATVKIHPMMLGIRNDADVAGFGAEVLNPFKPGRTLPRRNSMRLAAVI
jgi:hypothetical protein